MGRYLGLYRAFLVNRLKILMEYRVNFIIGASSTLVLEATSLLALWVVVRQVPDLNGWTLPQLLMVYGLLVLAKSLNHMFADNLWTLGWQYVRTGQFDRFLVRPIDPLFHLLADRFCHDGVGNFLVGSALVATAWAGLGIAVTPLNLAYLAMAVLSGGAIFIALNLITAVSSFWIVNSIPVIQVVFNTSEFAKYPLAIYPRAIGVLMTWLIPYGFASYYPASFLMGRDVGALAWLGPPVAAGLSFAAYRFWRFGLRHYAGAGS
ncbi:MAG TPA: ABC-2 family transporter protein [Chloroflexaceae bacterium]|nr:ABC-2 family transporter protein [Chloroflexaceae bacterium]